MGGDVHGREDRPTGPADRYGHGPHAVFQLLVDHGPSVAADVDEDLPQPAFVGHGPRRGAREVRGAEVGVQCRFREGGEEHPAHRGAERRQPRPHVEADRHDPLGRDPGHVDDVGSVEHARRGRLVDLLHQLAHVLQGDLLEGERREVGVPQFEDLRSQVEMPTVGAHVAQRFQGEQEATGRRPGEAGDAGHIAQRE